MCALGGEKRYEKMEYDYFYPRITFEIHILKIKRCFKGNKA